ncbi:MAG: hemerythrin domain-containing protein, partial [Thermodesulfobacteriota bacterium]
MSRQMLEIKYRCMHPSCVVNCREGVIAIDEEHFKELAAHYEEEDMFRSPRGFCRLGFSQPYKVREMEQLVEEEPAPIDPELEKADPIGILMAEHREILGMLEKLEDLIRKRDANALWAYTAEVENVLMLHSALKEEEVLFPAIRSMVSLSDVLVNIIKEDHSEILSLLHNFRTALQEGDLVDGVIRSMIVSLRSHIRKENYEFFELVDKAIEPAIKASIVKGMEEIVK